MKVICVLKSGGEYDEEWLRKLRDGVARNLTIPYTFHCLSDIDVPDRIPLRHNWPGWWSKIELFRVVDGPTLYLDLDTVVTGNLDHFASVPHDFAMLRNFHNPQMVGSGVMWFRKPLRKVYDSFCEKPFKHIAYHEAKRDGPYLGDQAFVWDSLGRKVEVLDNLGIRSYKMHCKQGLPEGTSLVCFHGLPKAPEVETDWMAAHWK
jgi:hypothetical protein